MKTCPKCKNVYPETTEYFHTRPNRSDLSGYCIKCANSLSSKRISNTRRNLKKIAVEIMGGKCHLCGFKKSIWAFDFHHLDSNQKDSGISNIKSISKLKEELKKCILICSNCHMEIHSGLHPSLLIVKESTNKATILRKKIKQEYIDYLGGKCKHCGYLKCNRSLSFHHLKDKKIPIGNLTYFPSLEEMKGELDKCILLCRNCHQIEHEKMVGLEGFEPPIIEL